MNWPYTLTLNSSPDELQLIPSFAEKLALKADLDEEVRYRMLLALSEAVTNAIIHGNKQDPGKTVTVRAEVFIDHILVEVTDQGEGFDTEALPDPLDRANLLKTSGRGVWLIRKHVDDVFFSREGRRVTLRFNR